jgi:AcrR family transcriptional regulator
VSAGLVSASTVSAAAVSAGPVFAGPVFAGTVLAGTGLAGTGLAGMTDRPLRADARRNRDRVLRAARAAFAAHGYGVPLDEIAALAGVGPGTVYRHFPSKEELFEAVVTERLRDLIEAARALAGDSDPGQAFFGFLGQFRTEVAAKRDLPDAIAVPGALQDDLRAALDVLLRRAQEHGAVRADITTQDLMALLKALVRTIGDQPPGAGDPARAERLIAVVFDGLRPRAPAQAAPPAAAQAGEARRDRARPG